MSPPVKVVHWHPAWDQRTGHPAGPDGDCVWLDRWRSKVTCAYCRDWLSDHPAPTLKQIRDQHVSQCLDALQQLPGVSDVEIKIACDGQVIASFRVTPQRPAEVIVLPNEVLTAITKPL
jgi:hypothetical protein